MHIRLYARFESLDRASSSRSRRPKLMWLRWPDVAMLRNVEEGMSKLPRCSICQYTAMAVVFAMPIDHQMLSDLG